MNAVVNSLSVIVEWENADDIPDTTALANLLNLGDRIVEAQDLFTGPATLVMVCDPLKNSRVAFDKAVDAMKERFGNRMVFKILEVPGSEYTDQKIAGAAATDSDIIVFADSDCRYRPTWLRQMLEPFRDPKVDYTHGRNVMMLDDVWGKAAAVYWFYPLEAEVPNGPTFVYFSNLAMRRAAYESYPFPGNPGTRVACAMWTRKLPQTGLRPRPTMATADHPPASGMAAVIAKAVDYGSIDDGRYAARDFGRGARFGRAFLRMLRETARVIKRTPYVAVRLKLNPLVALETAGIGFVYAFVSGFAQMRAALVDRPKTPTVAPIGAPASEH
jgi:hypothetical protein